MDSFYTSAIQHGNNILLRGVDNGQRYKVRVPLKPYLFINSKSSKRSEYKTLDGKSVERIDFDSVKDARDFIMQYKDISNMEIMGMTQFVYPYINDAFNDELRYDKQDRRNIVIGNLDIETDMGLDTTKVEKEITAITLKVGDVIHVFGTKDYTATDKRVEYHKSSNEDHMLIQFVNEWRKIDLDVVTGWNIEFYDIPYLVNRITRVLGEDWAKKLSPWQLLQSRTVEVFGKQQELYSLLGVATLDYMQLYKKFTYTNQETYRLDHICSVELGEKKLDYSEFGNLAELYRENYQKFIEYNIKDVILVEKLDEKLGLLDLAFTIAYDSKINYDDVFTTVRIWDIIIHNYLINAGVVVPQTAVTSKVEQFAGAYVKDPQCGFHDWVASFDINSLYPSLIVQYNISPETFRGKLRSNYSIEQILNGCFQDETIQKFIKENNYALTANSCLWSKEKKGALPALIEKMMEERKLYKNLMLDAKQEYENNPSKKLEADIARFNNMQMARKILMNSLYGALGNRFFRWFSVDFAEAITLSGQMVISTCEKKLNQYFNKLLKTDEVDYIIAVDTDSNYIKLGPLVEAIIGDASNEDKVTWVDKVCKQKIEPFLDKCFTELSIETNAYCNFMKMKREAIATRGIWTGKKHYALNVYDNEGIRYQEPKLKIMGLEAVKSSTPAPCRIAIKQALKLIMETDEETVQDYIEQFRKEFDKFPFEEIAFPRGCTNLIEYQASSSIYKKGTPIHVRGALLYNHLIKEQKLTNKYAPITDGDKLKFCYLKTPNHIQENVIAVPQALPQEFNLEKCIDRDKQFEKAFLSPLENILDVIGWRAVKINTLESLFG